MQVTRPGPPRPDISDKEIKDMQEFFSGETDANVTAQMNDRLMELEPKGHTLVRRVKIGRNEPCPCGSGKKFKKCHLESLKKEYP